MLTLKTFFPVVRGVAVPVNVQPELIPETAPVALIVTVADVPSSIEPDQLPDTSVIAAPVFGLAPFPRTV